MSSSQQHQQSRRQIMQPWPLCLIPFGSSQKSSKDKAILPKYYSRVPTINRSSTASSSLVQDCASNSTLLTNVSPFNSQAALITERSPHQERTEQHYYAENLRNNHHRTLNGSQIYDPLSKLDRELRDYKQLDPLLSKDETSSDTKILMDSQDFKSTGDKMTITVIKTKFDTSKPSKNYLTQVLAAFAVSLGSMVVGFAASYTSPALTTMKDRNFTSFEVTEESGSWIGSIMPLSALVGGIAGGPLIEYVGRRNTILFTAFPFGSAWLLIGLAYNISMVLMGRALSGFCVGVLSLSMPVYLGETIQPEVRGSLGLLPTAFGNIGILVCFTVGMYLDWSRLALFGACLPIPFGLLMIMIPETPRWYISKGNTKRARKSLQWLRGKDADVSEELTTVEKLHIESERQAASNPGTFFELFKGSNMKPLMISLGLMFFQQMSGINAVIFYTVQIFQDAGSDIDPNISTIIVGVVNFGATFVATTLIDRLGRKILLYMSSVSMIMSLFVLSGFFYMKNHGQEVSQFGYVPLVSFVVYVIGFSLGFGPIPWLMMGEILPAKIRGSAASVATSFNWACTFLVTKLFADVVAAVGQEGTFCGFGFICVVGLIFVVSCVPETSGRSLEEIERGLTGPVRRTSAVANMKPTPMAV